MIKQYVAIKNHVARLKVKVKSVLKLCAYASMKPVYVRPIIWTCMAGFENNLVQMVIMTKQFVTNKNHVVRSKVYMYVTVCT